MSARRIVFFLACALLLVGPVSPAGARGDAVARRLQDMYPRAERYSVDVENTRAKAGAARVLVKAPLTTTTSIVTDFGNYHTMLRNFDRSEVLGKRGDQTDVAVTVSILKGKSHIRGILRFDPPKQVGDEVVVHGRMIDGNVKRFEATYRLSAVDTETTVLNLEMLVELKLPFPNALVTRETADASDGTVSRLRTQSERRFQRTRGG